MSGILTGVASQQSESADAISERHTNTDYRCYSDVDLTDFLGGIAFNIIASPAHDWRITKDELLKAAQSEYPDDKWKMWRVSENDCTLLPECDVYIKYSEPYNRWQEGASDATLQGYYVNIKGSDGDAIKGDVFEIADYSEHARFIKDNAVTYETMGLQYNNGDFLKISKTEYDKMPDFYINLHGEPPPVITYYPFDDAALRDILINQHLERLDLPDKKIKIALQDTSLTEHQQALINSLTMSDGKSRQNTVKVKHSFKGSLIGKLNAAQKRVTAQNTSKTSKQKTKTNPTIE